MKTLITGASGLLGRSLLRTAPKFSPVVGTFLTPPGWPGLVQLDIEGLELCRAVVNEVKPDVVIHCAGDGRVDFAEENPSAAKAIIHTGTSNIVQAAAEVGAHLVYISTNAVYDGNSPLYREESQHLPVNVYGRIKSEAEVIVMGYPHKWTIIRPIMLYGWPQAGKRDNLATRVIGALQAGNIIRVAKDIVSQPTYVMDLAEAIWWIVQAQQSDKEVWNMAPKERMTLYDFAVTIAEVFGLYPGLIVPVASSAFEELARRPRNTCFDVRKLEQVYQLKAAREGLRAMKGEVCYPK